MVKVKKKTLRISGIILLFVAAFILSFNIIAAKIIEKKIDGFLANAHLKYYHIEYTRVGFNFLNRSVSIINFKYSPDSAFLDSLDRSGFNTMAPEITFGRLTVSGIDFEAAINGHNLIINKIKVKNPEIKLYKFNGKLLPANAEKKKLSLEDSVRLTGIKGISVATIAMKKSKFEIYNYKQKKYTLISKDISIALHGLTLEPSGHANTYFYPALHDASLVANDNVLELENDLYEIEFKQLTIDLKGQSLVFKGFHLKPRYSKITFSQHIKSQKERLDLKAEKIAFSGADFYRFLLENEIRIRKILIANASIGLFRDKRVPFDHSQRPLLPNQSLKRLKGKIKIDTVQIENVRFDYGEKTDLRTTSLKIFFTGLSGYITHINNFPYLWRKNPMLVSIKGSIINKASLKLKLTFPLAAKSDTFYFGGAVYGPVLLSAFNPAIYPAAGLKFDKGVLDTLTFEGGANPKYSSGTMKMLYHDMNIHAMKKKDGQITNKFLSWGANSLLRKNNPRKGDGKIPKVASMFFQRNMEKGFGNFFWKTIFSGMKATMLPSINTINRKNLQSVSQSGSAAINSKSKVEKKRKSKPAEKR